MPNRILKDSIVTSDNLNACSPEAQMLFVRLITRADDYGRFEARAAIVRGFCYPLALDHISDSDITCWLFELEQNRLIHIYQGDDGVPYLYLTNWEKHQRVRNKRSRYPQPSAQCGNPPQSAASCSESPQDAPTRAESNPIQSLSESNIYSPIPAESDTRLEIFNCWNSKDIIKHRKLTDKIRRSINGALGNYTQAEVVQAIDNYARILASKDHWFTYKWTLPDFLQRGLDKFIDWRVCDANYKGDEKRGGSARALPKQGEYEPAPVYNRPMLREGI